MERASILAHTWEVYAQNFWLLALMAIPGFFGLAIPVLIGTPSFIALGGSYLRTGSIPDLTPMSLATMLSSLLLSLFLMGFAIVNINLVVKSQRTLTQIKKEVIASISTTTLSVFWVFLVALLLLLIIQLLGYEYGLQAILSPIIALPIGLIMLFMPTAMVIDEIRPFRAMQRSVETIISKLPLVILWNVIALILLVIIDVIFLWLIPHPFASWLVLLVNSIIILPYLVVLLAQIYISKYTILE